MKVYTKSQKTELHKDIDKYFEKVDQPLVVQRHDPKRTESQQGKIHSLMREIAIHAGCDPEWFKQNVIKRNSEGVFPSWPNDLVTTLKGDSDVCPKSESKLTKREESEVIEALYALGGEWGVEFKEAS